MSSAYAGRFGYCCKWLPREGDEAARKAANTRIVTVTWMGRQEPGVAAARLFEVVAHNLRATLWQVETVAKGPRANRLLRIPSDILPGFTHPAIRPFYADAGMRSLVEDGLSGIGEAARGSGVRMSMHPDQFCVISSGDDRVRDASVAEIEYHADVMAMMGYGSGWHPDGAHVNVHGGAKARGAEAFRMAWKGLSERARNLVTVENDELSYGLDDLLPVHDEIPLVLDIHHHWIASRGEWMRPGDPRISKVIASWRGVRPVAHVSVSRREFVAGSASDLPCYSAAVAGGAKVGDLRAHADTIWNDALARLVGDHLAWTDFEVEAKAKNLAVEDLSVKLARLQAAADPSSSMPSVGR